MTATRCPRATSMPSGSSPSSVDDEQLGEPVGGGNSRLVDAGLAVNPDPDAHATVGHGEQRCGSARQRAAAERNTERSGAFVRESGHPLDLIDRVAGFGCPGGRLEHRECARDAPSLVLLGDRRAGDVVRHHDGAAVDPDGSQLLLRLVEVQYVTGVVAVREQYPATEVCRCRNGLHLMRGRARRTGFPSQHRGRGPDPPGHQRPGSDRTHRRSRRRSNRSSKRCCGSLHRSLCAPGRRLPRRNHRSARQQMQLDH